MRGFFRKLEDMMVAATFAEAGEWETAREVMPADETGRAEAGILEKTFAAVAFAEAGLFDEAVQFAGLAGGSLGYRSAATGDLGIAGVYMTFGTVSFEA